MSMWHCTENRHFLISVINCWYARGVPAKMKLVECTNEDNNGESLTSSSSTDGGDTTIATAQWRYTTVARHSQKNCSSMVEYCAGWAISNRALACRIVALDDADDDDDVTDFFFFLLDLLLWLEVDRKYCWHVCWQFVYWWHRYWYIAIL